MANRKPQPQKSRAPKSPPPKKAEFFTPAQVAEALQVNNGNATAAARVLQCHPQTVRAYCERYPEVQQARQRGEDIRIDVAEAALDRAVVKGEGWAVCFLLKTRGRSRGYIERFESEARNLNIDLSALSDDEIAAIARGEDPLAVLARSSRRG